MMIQYKTEIIQKDNKFIITGYIWIGPYAWGIDCYPKEFNTMEDAANWLIHNYKS